MSSQMAQLQEATIKAQCRTLRMPMMASQFGTLAEQAIREKKSHIGYLEALLLAEIEERERNTIERRIKEAHLPRVKTLEEFDYAQSPNVTAAKMRDLAEGGISHGPNALAHRPVCSGMPAEAPRSFHDRRRTLK